MEESGRLGAAKEARQSNLAAGRCQQVHAANDIRDALEMVIDSHRPLISPVPESIAHEDVAALLRRILRLRPEPAIDERLRAGIHPDAPAQTIDEAESAMAARAGIAKFDGAGAGVRVTGGGNLLSCAVAAVHHPARHQRLERVAIDDAALALARHLFVRDESEPREILANRALVLGPAALRVVVLDPQHDTATVSAGHLPHVHGVAHVAEMQVAGRRRRKARSQARIVARGGKGGKR